MRLTHRVVSLPVPRLALAALLLTALAAGQALGGPLSGEAQKGGRSFRAAFAPAAAVCRASVVRVLRDGEPASLGVAVTADGYILTKASQLGGPVTVVLPDGREVAAEPAGRHGASDLALLRADATNLVPLDWSADTDLEPGVGSWLVSVSDREIPAGVGVVSVAARPIAPQRGVLGVVLGDGGSGGATVNKVFEESGAARAGLRVGDIITAIAGESVPSRHALMARLSRYRPGDTLPLAVRRADSDDIEEVTATLGNEWSATMDRQARQNLLAGPLSVRSGGFDRALQHDTVLRPEDCGGPLVDLTGRVVGLNIARAGRVESYALPTATVRPILRDLLRARTESVSAR